MSHRKLWKVISIYIYSHVQTVDVPLPCCALFRLPKGTLAGWWFHSFPLDVRLRVKVAWMFVPRFRLCMGWPKDHQSHSCISMFSMLSLSDWWTHMFLTGTSENHKGPVPSLHVCGCHFHAAAFCATIWTIFGSERCPIFGQTYPAWETYKKL